MTWASNYLSFMGRNLDTKEKLTPIWIMKGANMNSKYIMNRVSFVKDYYYE